MARRAEIVRVRAGFVTRLTLMAHRPVSASGRCVPWFEADRYDPPRPRCVAPMTRLAWRVEDGGAAYWFTSEAELDHFAEIWGRQVLPTPRRLAEDHGITAVNGVWLSRMRKPSWPRRRALLAWMAKNDRAFRTALRRLS